MTPKRGVAQGSEAWSCLVTRSQPGFVRHLWSRNKAFWQKILFEMPFEVFSWGFVPQQCRKLGRVMKVTSSPVEQSSDIRCKAPVTRQICICLSALKKCSCFAAHRASRGLELNTAVCKTSCCMAQSRC
jgi:hypothetical protein